MRRLPHRQRCASTHDVRQDTPTTCVELSSSLRDEEGPVSLTELSLSWVCRHVKGLCVSREDGSLKFLHCPPSIAIFCVFLFSGVLNDQTVGIFQDVELLRLRRAFVQYSQISVDSFKLALCPHKLQELNVSHIHNNISISDILNSITSSTVCRQALRTLLIDGLRFYGETVSFSTLRGLKKLSLAWTDLDDKNLEEICSMPSLESLDISGTNITDLSPLMNIQSQLKFLTAHGLQKLSMPTSAIISVLSKLHLLMHLDISNDKLVTEGDHLAEKLLEHPGVFQNLVSLDVSGWGGVNDAAVRVFVEERRGMRFIGLLGTGAGGVELQSGDGMLKVAGESNLPQLCEALRRYRERETFIREVLAHLYTQTIEMEEPQPIILKLVLSVMRLYPDSLQVQLLTSACVFNLTQHELVLGMTSLLLGAAVKQLLGAMKSFPNHQQLLMNCLLTLCSDHILQVIPFDRYEAAKLIMMLPGNQEDQMLQRMVVAVLSNLVSQVINQSGQHHSMIK
ncbi:hypothetical protein DNTS_010988 [Danionella cerebrum]|uniref:Protein zer-1 homolog-like C-terminal domain-containing protein n=1 Tax=Danionella cerebrum TaxID=2873325 RepID=A0A553QZZ2_9TELE|nr:hypothetical protein DNTS_010988 [Danionella translucida]